jgi:hypothetical protein
LSSIFEKIVLPIFGVFGVLITFITFIFPQYANAQVPLPVYVSTILMLLLVCSIFIKLYIDIKKHINDNVYFNNFKMKPIQYITDKYTLILRRTIDIPLNTAVSIFIQEGLYESIRGIGYVSHVQEKIIHITISSQDVNINTFLNNESNLKDVVIRPASNINHIIGGIPQ